MRAPERIAADLSPAVEQEVYRIAQEALENVARHADATSVLLTLEQSAGRLALTIEDNGRGIDAGVIKAAEAGGQNHVGIRGMVERANLIDAELEITTEAGQGTRVYLTIPLSPSPASKSLAKPQPRAAPNVQEEG